MALPILGTGTDEWLSTELLVVLCVILVVLYYYYATSYHGVWEKVGVPGPKPWPFFDHRLEIGRVGLDATITKWFKQYGNTFGVYGLHPHLASLVTKDLDLIKQVLVTDSDNFINRIPGLITWGTFRKGIAQSKDDTWKRQRHAMSSMFTGSKLKIMMTHVVASAGTVREVIKQSIANNDLINVKEIANKFSTEVIARIGFGITTHAISREKSEFEFYSRELLKFNIIAINFIKNVSFYFPPITRLAYFIPYFDAISRDADSYFINIVKSTMKMRKEKRKIGGVDQVKDLLDLMMDKEADKPNINDPILSFLSEDEIIANCVNLIIAGVETVSTTIESIMYCLCTHPEVQEKLVAEIDTVIPSGETIRYEHLSQLKYTEQVIQECLRLYPPVTMLSRLVSNTNSYNGITIPKGTVVEIPIGMILKDPEYFPEPDKFDPDRFSLEIKSERDPVTYLAFSYGPRICISQRLGIMELKVIIACFMKEMRFSLSNRTESREGETIKKLIVGDALFRHHKPLEIEANFRRDFS